MKNNKRISPLLKWAGGKRWLVDYLLQYWDKHKERYFVEPFVGGMGITLGLFPKKALLNDANEHLINFYKWVQKGLIIELEMKYNKDIYLSYRERFNKLIKEGKSNSKEAAELFYYLNRTCFNGLCRFNSSGEFNVPFGKYKTVNYKTDFSEYKEVLKDWNFVTGDFSELVFDEDSFVYADPPYDVEFTQYTKDSFSWNDQVRLIEFLDKHKGPVIISNQLTERIYNLYTKAGYKIITLSAPRRINSNGDRKGVLEVLAIKNVG